MADNEAFVQVAPDGVGKKVRNFQLVVLQPDGSLATVMQQAVAIIDPSTGLAMTFAPDGWHEAVLTRLTAIARGLEVLSETNLLEGADDGS